MENENRPKRTLEPGTLDKTRKNIGPIDANEALFMQKNLAGKFSAKNYLQQTIQICRQTGEGRMLW